MLKKGNTNIISLKGIALLCFYFCTQGLYADEISDPKYFIKQGIQITNKFHRAWIDSTSTEVVKEIKRLNDIGHALYKAGQEQNNSNYIAYGAYFISGNYRILLGSDYNKPEGKIHSSEEYFRYLSITDNLLDELDHARQLSTLEYISEMHYEYGNNDSLSMIHLENFIHRAMGESPNKSIGRAYIKLGILSHNAQQYNNAFKYYLHGQKLLEPLAGDNQEIDRLLSLSHLGIGASMIRLGIYDTSIPHIKNSVTFHKFINDDYGLLLSLTHLATSMQGATQNSTMYNELNTIQNDITRIANKHKGDERITAIANAYFGNQWIEQDTDLAFKSLEYFKNTEELEEESQYNQLRAIPVSKTLYALARCYKVKDRVPEYVQILSRLYNHAIRTKDYHYAKLTGTELARHFKNKKEFTKADQYFSSIKGFEHLEKIESIDLLYQSNSLKSDLRIASQTERSEVLKAQEFKNITKERELIILNLILLCGIITIGILFVNRMRRQKQLEAQLLVEQNEIKVKLQQETKQRLEYLEKTFSKKLMSIQNYQNLSSRIQGGLTQKLPQSEKNKLRDIINSDKSSNKFSSKSPKITDHDLNEIFLNQLRKVAPALTKKNLALCILFKSNLSVREIAKLNNSAESSVRVAKYRIKTKLGLESSDSLRAYLNKIEQEAKGLKPSS